MKYRGAVLVAGVLTSLLVPGFARAQGSGLPPPGCCYMASDLDGQSRESASRSRLDIAESAIERMGLTHSQFIDRLSDAMFPGKQVAVVIPSSRISSKWVGSGKYGLQEQDLVAVQETWFYRFDRNRMRSEDLEGAAELYLTDGETYLKISFVRGDDESKSR
jgi:hypothetical protein